MVLPLRPAASARVEVKLVENFHSKGDPVKMEVDNAPTRGLPDRPVPAHGETEDFEDL